VIYRTNCLQHSLHHERNITQIDATHPDLTHKSKLSRRQHTATPCCIPMIESSSYTQGALIEGLPPMGATLIWQHGAKRLYVGGSSVADQADACRALGIHSKICLAGTWIAHCAYGMCFGISTMWLGMHVCESVHCPSKCVCVSAKSVLSQLLHVP
jgi:hypothetical protein